LREWTCAVTNLRYERLRRGWSLCAVAADTTLNLWHIQKIETQRYPAGKFAREALSELYNMSVDTLFDAEGIAL